MPLTQHRASAIALGIFLQLGAMAAGHAQAARDLKVGDQVSVRYSAPLRDGEFRKAWFPDFESISCARVSDQPLSASDPQDYHHCLRFGPLKLGDQFQQLQAILTRLKQIPADHIAQPRQVSRAPDGGTVVLIPVSTTTSGDKVHMQSYLVISRNDQDVVRSLQLTGYPSAASEALAFSSVTLGMPRDKVIGFLGLPSSVSDVPQVQGKLWNYAPFPFSIEPVKDRVYSVLIHLPDQKDMDKAFRPLAALPQ